MIAMQVDNVQEIERLRAKVARLDRECVRKDVARQV